MFLDVYSKKEDDCIYFKRYFQKKEDTNLYNNNAEIFNFYHGYLSIELTDIKEYYFLKKLNLQILYDELTIF